MTTPEVLTKNIADALLLQLGASNATMSYPALAASNLPPQIKLFALAALKDAARAEVMQLGSNLFRYQDLPTQLKASFANALAETAALTPLQLAETLQRSVLLTHRLLASPHQTLIETAFGNRNEESADEIIGRLERICEYCYLVDVFAQYLEKKQVASMSREKAERLIGEIDRRLCASYAPDETLRLFQPMYSFYALGGEKEVPIELLILFSREKDMQPLTASLEQLKFGGAGALNFSDVSRAVNGEIDDLLKRLAPIPAAPKTLAPSFEDALMREVEAQLTAVASPPEISAARPNDEIKVESSFSVETKKVETSAEPPSEPLVAVKAESVSSAKALDEATSEQGAPPTESGIMPKPQKPSPMTPKRREEPTAPIRYLPPTPPSNNDAELDDLRVLITEDLRKKIIRRLFKGSEANYDAAIADLNQKKTWRESSHYIDEEIFTRYQVDEYSIEAVQFTDIVFNRYHRKP